MRLLLLLTAVLAVLIAGCGDAEQEPAKTTVNESTALPLTVEREGGVAGIQQRLVVRRDGTGTITSPREPARELSTAETAAVRRALRELVFDGLDERYGPPDGTMVADGIDYAFTAGGRTIVVQEMAEDVPEALGELKRAAGEAMNG